MYTQSYNTSGAKWIFWLAIIILLAVFALGFNLKEAEAVEWNTASATAEQMNAVTDAERQKSEIPLELLTAQTEIKIAQQKQHAEFEKLKLQQEINALILAETQKADFRNGLYTTLNIGLMALMVAFSIALSAFGINASFGLRKDFSVSRSLAT